MLSVLGAILWARSKLSSSREEKEVVEELVEEAISALRAKVRSQALI